MCVDAKHGFDALEMERSDYLLQHVLLGCLHSLQLITHGILVV
jgi:hypothetical protein